MLLCFLPSLVGRAFLIQSVRCLTKSKKKSPSGTLITLSAIFTNKLNPSLDLRFNLWAIFWQKSLALVDESTSKAWNFLTIRLLFYLFVLSLPHQYHLESKLCEISEWSYAGWLQPPPDVAGIFSGRVVKSFAIFVWSPVLWGVVVFFGIESNLSLNSGCRQTTR